MVLSARVLSVRFEKFGVEQGPIPPGAWLGPGIMRPPNPFRSKSEAVLQAGRAPSWESEGLIPRGNMTLSERGLSLPSTICSWGATVLGQLHALPAPLPPRAVVRLEWIMDVRPQGSV